MGDLKMNQHALHELNRTREKTLAHANVTMEQQMIAKQQPTPQEEFTQLVLHLQAIVRAQQLKTEQTIQQTMQQASTALKDAQNVDALSLQVQAMQQALTQQGVNNEPQYYLSLLQQLETTVHEQLHYSDQQVAQSLQQAIATMSQAQVAMFDSQSFAKMSDVVKQCGKIVHGWQHSNQLMVH
ncbi:MAG: hypothetical protein NUK65_03770 [Firmicutes bacterium]|nr:hypothetical protein [Bacillota bacterium]